MASSFRDRRADIPLEQGQSSTYQRKHSVAFEAEALRQATRVIVEVKRSTLKVKALFLCRVQAENEGLSDYYKFGCNSHTLIPLDVSAVTDSKCKTQ